MADVPRLNRPNLHLLIRRQPELYRASCIFVCAAHVVGCYTAATCRGYPAPPWWTIPAMYVAPFFCGFPALFDDDRSVRHRGVIQMSVAMGIIHAVAWCNLAYARPHPGHHLGFLGLLLAILPWLPFAFVTIPVMAFCLLFVERVFGDCWGLFRRFRPDLLAGTTQTAGNHPVHRSRACEGSQMDNQLSRPGDG
ncbi:hypothetical protein K227x_22750 [Rubripirellula lacrimiformis]|uniref:Uncharacterized protein n=1 Tax=Rubripirellula lacrimiformis TaxID=1930273 RepID=A0A517N9T5_9BACT|nr:hypothetical protein K227x_22750 [Rubripirellula lacrimiformis]